MTDTPEWLDTTRPNVARVYDYWLDGKDNFAPDRELAESMLAVFPGLRELVRANRQFITRAVTWVAQQGIDQFIDAGAGLPTAASTHESAQAVNPQAKIAYVDNDLVVIRHAEALLAGRNGRVSVVRADLRDPRPHAARAGDADRRRQIDRAGHAGTSALTPVSARPMISFWICDVPS